MELIIKRDFEKNGFTLLSIQDQIKDPFIIFPIFLRAVKLKK